DVAGEAVCEPHFGLAGGAVEDHRLHLVPLHRLHERRVARFAALLALDGGALARVREGLSGGLGAGQDGDDHRDDDRDEAECEHDDVAAAPGRFGVHPRQPSFRSRLTAALISERCVKACGKLPSSSPLGPISSEYRPRWFAYVSIFSNARRASWTRPA